MTRAPFRLLAAGSLAFLASTSAAPAQVQSDWSRSFGGPAAFDRLRDLAFDGAGHTWVSGVSVQAGSSYAAGFVTVYDAAGNTVWTGISSAPNLLIGMADIAVDPTGGVVVTGGSTDPNVQDSTLLLVLKYDSSGHLAWRSTFGPTGTHEPIFRKLVVDADGRTYAVGREKHTYAGQRTRGLIVAYSPTGGHLWTLRPDLSDHEDLLDAALDASGNLHVTGTSDGLYVAKITPGGAIAWQRVFPGIATDGYLTALDGAGTVYVGGGRQNVSTGHVVLTAAFDAADGSPRWFHEETGPHYLNFLAGFAFSPTGEILSLSRANLNGADRSDTLLVARSPSGALLRRVVYDAGLGRHETPWAMAVAPNGDVHVLGFSSNVEETDTRQTLLRFSRADADGPIWVIDQGPLAPILAYGRSLIALDPSGGVVTSGNFGLAFNLTDVVTARVSILAEALCFGDGSGTACPCGNASASALEAGCMNSLGRAGKLDWRGSPSLTGDTLELVGIDMPDSSALYLQGSQALQGGAGVTFGDGLRCAGGLIQRLGIRTNAGGASSYPGPGDAAVSLRGGVTLPGTRIYQVWYRNAAEYCTPGAFNLTNALRVTWIW